MTSRLVPPPHQHPAVPARPERERGKPETPPRRTLVIATHAPEIIALSERVILIGEGRILADGPRAKLVASPIPTPSTSPTSPTSPAPQTAPERGPDGGADK